MSSTYTSLHYHLIFSTKNREPLMGVGWRGAMHEYLGGMVRGLGGVAECVGGVADHVHLLVSLKPTNTLADFMRELKKASSVWAAEKKGSQNFRWQEGYAALTVSPSARATVRDYIARQEEHHRHKTFHEELIEFLQKAGVEFDERYLD